MASLGGAFMILVITVISFYAEVLSMTRNFERVVGKGGFATVYHGWIDDTEVAVKMLSPSAQGYLQFQAEVI